MGRNIYIQPTFVARQLDFYVYDGNRFVSWGAPVLSEAVEGVSNNPSLSLEYDEGQIILDELWRNGFRPSPKLIGETSNRDLHLADLRKLVSKAYKVNL